MKATVTELRTRRVMDDYALFNDCDRDVRRALEQIVRSKRYSGELILYLFARQTTQLFEHVPLQNKNRNTLVVWHMKNLLRAWVRHWKIVRVWKQIRDRRRKDCAKLKKELE